MSKLILATTSSKGPNRQKITKNETIVVESDKIIVLPVDGGAGSLIIANGWEFTVAAEVAEIATAMDAADASAYT